MLVYFNAARMKENRNFYYHCPVSRSLGDRIHKIELEQPTDYKGRKLFKQYLDTATKCEVCKTERVSPEDCPFLNTLGITIAEII